MKKLMFAMMFGSMVSYGAMSFSGLSMPFVLSDKDLTKALETLADVTKKAKELQGADYEKGGHFLARGVELSNGVLGNCQNRARIADTKTFKIIRSEECEIAKEIGVGESKLKITIGILLTRENLETMKTAIEKGTKDLIIRSSTTSLVNLSNPISHQHSAIVKCDADKKVCEVEAKTSQPPVDNF